MIVKIDVDSLIGIWLSRNPKLIRNFLLMLKDQIFTYINNINCPEIYIRNWKMFLFWECESIYIDYHPWKVREVIEIGKTVILFARLWIALQSKDWDEGDVILEDIYPQKFARIEAKVHAP